MDAIAYTIAYIPHEQKKGVAVIAIDGEPWKTVSLSLFGRKPALPKKIASEVELQEWFDLEIKSKAKAFVYKRLGQKSYLSHELLSLLADQGVPHQIAAEVVQECIHQGYVNDEEWAHSFIRFRIRRGDGPRLILMKLLQKGIQEGVAKTLLREYDAPDDRKEKLAAIIAKSMRKHPSDMRKAKEKSVAAALRKGFSLDEVLSQFRDDA